MRSRIVAVVSYALLLAACGGGTSSPPGTPDAATSPTPVAVAAECAGGSQAFFEDMQHDTPGGGNWTVYCPTWLPTGMESKPRPSGGSGDAHWVNAAGHSIDLIQGSASSLFIVETPNGMVQPSGKAPFGDLTADVYPEQSTLVVFDGNQVGHRLSADGVALDDLLHVAKSMVPVSPEVASLLNADNTSGLMLQRSAIPEGIDSAGQDRRNPFVCEKQPNAGDRASVVARWFAPPPPGPEPDWELPFTMETLVRFRDERAASAYIHDVRALAQACPATRPGTNSTTAFSQVDVSSVVAQPGVDDAIAFTEVNRSEVQALQPEVLYAASGAHVVILTRERTLAHDAPAFDTSDLVALLSKAVERIAPANPAPAPTSVGPNGHLYLANAGLPS